MLKLLHKPGRASIGSFHKRQLRRGFFVRFNTFQQLTLKRIPSIGTSFLLLVVLSGCEKSDLGTVDASENAPYMSGAVITPSSVNIDTLASVNGLYKVTSTVMVHVADPDGLHNIEQVSYQIFQPSATSAFASGLLSLTSGQSDTTSSTFSADLSFSVARSEVGNYRVAVFALDKSGLSSTAVQLTLRVTKANSAPVVGLPSVRRLTIAGSSEPVQVKLSLAVSDSDGIDDIFLVWIRTTGAADTSSHPMYDDGVSQHGDLAAGDGLYTTILLVQPLSTIQNVVFEFAAQDRIGAPSNLVQRTIQNSPPQILGLSVPDSIQRPASGIRLIPFFETVADSDGLADIDSVYFRNESSQTPSDILMYDDGDLVVHGDSTRGDGVYSRIVSIDPSTSTGPKKFHFFVVDKAATQDSRIHFITIY